MITTEHIDRGEKWPLAKHAKNAEREGEALDTGS